MKTRLFFLMIAMVAIVNGAFSQMTRGDREKIAELNKKISESRYKIGKYEARLINLNDYSSDIQKLKIEADSLNRLSPETSYGKDLKKQAVRENKERLSRLLVQQKNFQAWSPKVVERDSLLAKIQRYELQKDQISESYVANNDLPAEMSNCEEHRRLNSLNVSREQRLENTEEIYTEMDIKKLASQSVRADSTKGYFGIIHNLSIRSRIKFDIYRINVNGVKAERASASFATNPGDKRNAYLLPGKYIAYAFQNGNVIGQEIFHVNSESYDYFGEQAHFYLFREGY